MSRVINIFYENLNLISISTYNA